MKNTLTSLRFQKVISNYKTEPTVEGMADVLECFELLAKNILKVFMDKKIREVFKNKKRTVYEMMCFAYIKIERFDPAKGKAFNYFTTIMLGWLRQVYRTKRKYAELKAAYKSYLGKKTV